jgi:uncharacterized protein
MQGIECLRNKLGQYAPLVIALSGGTDSRLLLAFAHHLGIPVAAVTVDTGLNPAGELDEARNLAKRLGIVFVVVKADMLQIPAIRGNASNRCYICKKVMMQEILEWTVKSGYRTLVDGTNADDVPEDRPGMRALVELGIHSPFRECGIGKKEIVKLASKLGISALPPSSCLATRFLENTQITEIDVDRVRKAESMLRKSGVRGRLRVRIKRDAAIVEADPSQHPIINKHIDAVKKLGFGSVSIQQSEEKWNG